MGKVYADLKVNGDLIYNNNPTDGYFLTTDGDGLVSFTQSSVIESVDYASLPVTGLGSRLYITLNNNNTYRWDGAAYQPITGLLLTTNIIYVSKSGNDTLGARHDLGKPFLTVEAAVAVAQAGDLIKIFPGTYTITSNIAKDGVSYYLEPGAVLIKTTSGNMFDTTGFTTSFDVFGYGEFRKTTNSGYICRFNSSFGYPITFQANKVTSSTYSIFRIDTSTNVHFKVDYCTSTGGSCMEMNQGNSETVIVIDAIYWKSTAGNVINRAYWWGYTTLTINASKFESTTSYTIDGFAIYNNITLNINQILGVTYAISTGDPYFSTTMTINCDFCTGINHGCEIIFNGLCGSLRQVGYSNRSRFIGGSCNYITIENGYIETNLGSYGIVPVNTPFISISGGTAKIKNVIAGYQFGLESTGGKLYLYEIAGLPRNSTDVMRTINGGTVYVYDFLGYEVFPDYGYGAGFYLISGNLHLRGRLEMPASKPFQNCEMSVMTNNLIRTNAVVWLGGNLIADGCIIKTADPNDQAIVCRGSAKNIQITSKGLTTNRPDNGGTFTAKKMKMLLNSMTYYANAGFTLACNGVSVNFSTTTAGKTLEMLATEFIGLINVSTLPIVASTYTSDPQYWYIESTIPGAPITWDVYKTPYTGDRGLDRTYIVRDASSTITNILGGYINENNNII